MFTKKFTSKKEAQLFKKQYSDNEIETEVIFNILQPHMENTYSELKEYFDFYFNHSNDSNKINTLRFYCEAKSLDILEKIYGKCDFTFSGNRTYKIYIFEFKGLTFITPAKREVVVSGNLQEHIPVIVEFEKEFQQFLFTHVLNDFDNLPDFIQSDVLELRQKGILSQDNIIHFDYFSKKKLIP